MMTKQEEIRAGIRQRFETARQEGTQSQEWKLDADVDDMLAFLASQGMVLKVDRELPNWYRAVGAARLPIPLTRDEVQAAGWTPVEPLI